AEVGDALTELAQTESAHAVTELARSGAGDGRLVAALELIGVVGEQALADELQQHVIVALEGDVDVEVGAQPSETVLRHDPCATAGLAGLLQSVERSPRRQRLQARRESLEVFAILVSVLLARE